MSLQNKNSAAAANRKNNGGLPEKGGPEMEYDFKNLTFHEIIDEELERTLASRSRKIIIPGNKVFLTEGDELDMLYYIRAGTVSLYMADRNGAEKTLYRLTRGWFFGEIVCQLNLRRTSLLFIADEETTLYGINDYAVAALMDEDSKFRNSLLRCTCYKTIALRYEIANFTFCPSKTRLLKSLYRDVDSSKLIDGRWYALAKRRTHYELGVDIGATRVTVSRLIGELCCEGRLRTVNNQIQFSRRLYEAISAETQDPESFIKTQNPYCDNFDNF